VERQTPKCMKMEEPWQWRMRMARRLAAELDSERLGVAALYVIGSTRNATAGEGSDIDLLIHFRGNEAQEQELRKWLEGWSRSLAEMNFERTGFRSEGLLDLHLVTDADIEQKTSYAVKIGASSDAALLL
jgi:pyruvate,water dikinase